MTKLLHYTKMQTTDMPYTENLHCFSISITKDLFNRLKVAVPKYGQRSRLICLLIKGFLEGKFQVTIK